MARNLYIVVADAQTSGYCHTFRDSAWLDNGDGTSLLSVNFHDDDLQAQFEALSEVQPLLVGQTVTPAQAATLAYLGVVGTDTTADVLRKARAVYRAM